uniref:IP14831p n=1 Tax=Drosophila melanogaster TaxID=7227 RepID=D9PTW8_DROME|nr:IP14831p [Drosophila melanogaster]
MCRPFLFNFSHQNSKMMLMLKTKNRFKKSDNASVLSAYLSQSLSSTLPLSLSISLCLSLSVYKLNHPKNPFKN